MQRSPYWGYSIAAIAVLNVIVLPIFFVFRAIGISATLAAAMAQMFAIPSLPFLWILLSLAAKRCHDRDRSAWFLLVGLIPVIGWLWLLIELGLLEGTAGENRFGPSPKAVMSDQGRIAP
ncbi:MAG: DUF805 domain-containing protein [Alphaproteobacteria bacterium]|nr:DUF805 domain-containing protein [Alphaproteobacteria bacterium]